MSRITSISSGLIKQGRDEIAERDETRNPALRPVRNAVPGSLVGHFVHDRFVFAATEQHGAAQEDQRG